MRDLAQWLLARDDFAVCGHLSPDGDSFGSAIALTLALRGLGKRAFAASPEPIPHMYAFLPGRETVFLARRGASSMWTPPARTASACASRARTPWTAR